MQRCFLIKNHVLLHSATKPKNTNFLKKVIAYFSKMDIYFCPFFKNLYYFIFRFFMGVYFMTDNIKIERVGVNPY